MAACGGLEHIFQKPLPETTTFLESLSPWKQIKSLKPIDDSSSSFTEIFGELHFKETRFHSFPSSSSLNEIDVCETSTTDQERENASAQRKQYRKNESFSLCTEGLGFESFDDVEHAWPDEDADAEMEIDLESNSHSENYHGEVEAAPPMGGRALPPPISCIGRCGMPWVCLKSYRENGRLIMKEIRILTQEFLHACRQDGRLKLQFVLNDEGDEEIEGGNEVAE